MSVLALFQQQDLWSALEWVLVAERDGQSRASVYCSSDAERWQRVGIVKWLDSVLSGALVERYRSAAAEQLGLTPKPDEAALTGSPYMDPDGFEPITNNGA